MGMRKFKSKAEKSNSSWIGHDWLPIFPANQLRRASYREIYSHFNLCDQHPLELCRAQPKRLIQRPWAFHLSQWKPLHSYHIPTDLVWFFWLQVQQCCVHTKLCLWQQCVLIVNFPDLPSSSTWVNHSAAHVHFNED